MQDCFQISKKKKATITLVKSAENSFLVCNGSARVFQYVIKSNNQARYVRYFEFQSKIVDFSLLNSKADTLSFFVLASNEDCGLIKVFFESYNTDDRDKLKYLVDED